MRDYLYIWNDPTEQCIVASGIEFKSLSPYFKTDKALLLIDHHSLSGRHDFHSGFDFFAHADVGDLVAEDIYSWGNFVWVDYQSSESLPFSPPELTPEEVAELLYFAHAGKPLRKVLIPNLRNQFLAHAHDDGWLLKLYYTEWSHVELLLRVVVAQKLGSLDMNKLKDGNTAFWLHQGSVSDEEITLNINSIINRRLQKAS